MKNLWPVLLVVLGAVLLFGRKAQQPAVAAGPVVERTAPKPAVVPGSVGELADVLVVERNGVRSTQDLNMDQELYKRAGYTILGRPPKGVNIHEWRP